MMRLLAGLLVCCALGACGTSRPFAPLVPLTPPVCLEPPPPTPVVMRTPTYVVREQSDGSVLVGMSPAEYLKTADNLQTLLLALKERTLIIKYLKECISWHEKTYGADRQSPVE